MFTFSSVAILFVKCLAKSGSFSAVSPPTTKCASNLGQKKGTEGGRPGPRRGATGPPPPGRAVPRQLHRSRSTLLARQFTSSGRRRRKKKIVFLSSCFFPGAEIRLNLAWGGNAHPFLFLVVPSPKWPCLTGASRKRGAFSRASSAARSLPSAAW